MADRPEQQPPVVLRSDVPGDELKVRAVLAGWGLAEGEINWLLGAERPPAPPAPTNPYYTTANPAGARLER